MPTGTSDETIAPWDVVLVPFPYTEGEGEKRRPALVVSARSLLRAHGLLWLAMITSADNRPWSGDVVIRDLARAGLPAPSLVRPAKITTLQSDRIVRRVGDLSPAERRSVVGALKKNLAGSL